MRIVFAFRFRVCLGGLEKVENQFLFKKRMVG